MAGFDGGVTTVAATFDAIGDLLVGTGNDSSDVLSIGSTGNLLTIACGTPAWTDTITSTGSFTIDVATDIVLDADGDNITFKAGSGDSTGLDFSNSSGTWTIKPGTANGDLIFQVNDGCVASTLMTLDGGCSFISVGGNSINSGEIRFLEDTDNGSNYVAVKALATLGNTWTFTLPDCNGSACQALLTNGCGVTSWGSAGVGLGLVIALS